MQSRCVFSRIKSGDFTFLWFWTCQGATFSNVVCDNLCLAVSGHFLKFRADILTVSVTELQLAWGTKGFLAHISLANQALVRSWHLLDVCFLTWNWLYERNCASHNVDVIYSPVVAQGCTCWTISTKASWLSEMMRNGPCLLDNCQGHSNESEFSSGRLSILVHVCRFEFDWSSRLNLMSKRRFQTIQINHGQLWLSICNLYSQTTVAFPDEANFFFFCAVWMKSNQKMCLYSQKALAATWHFTVILVHEQILKC